MRFYDKEQFKHPSKEYSIAPFWFLNGDLDDTELVRQLTEMKEKGVDQVILHSRKGIEIGYLSKEWFQKIGVILDECERLEMSVLIYDEDNWPSGYAGGKITSENPDFAAICLSVDKIYPIIGEDIVVENKPFTEIECVIAVHNDEYFLDITDYQRKTNKPWHSETLQWEVFVFRKEKCGHRPAYSPYPYVDLLNPEAARAFVRHTHAEYKKRFSRQWGKVIKGFFTDEPGFYQNYLEQCKNLNTVIWTNDFAERFQKKFGYDIRPLLCCLWQNMGAISTKTRCDYYSAVAEFYKEGYFNVIADFLHKDGLMHIGHLHREDFIESLVQTESDFFSAMSALDASGIDCIDKNPARITERLGSSAAHIYEKEVCFSETFGCFGWGLIPEEMKRWADLQYVQGVNMLVPHAFFYSTDGIRKNESPPSLFLQNGYWRYFNQFSDYVRRLSYIGRAGKFVADVAIYIPMKTAWAEFRPLYRYFLHELDEQLLSLTEQLNHSGVCFDFLDDTGIDLCSLQGDELTGIEKSSYKVIILPSTTVLPKATLAKLAAFTKNGGHVISLGDFNPTDDTGIRDSDFTATLDSLKNARHFKTLGKHREDEVLSIIKEIIPGDIVKGDANGVFVLKRQDENKEIRFLVNRTDSKKTFTMHAANFQSAQIWNAENGEITSADFAKAGDGVGVSIELLPFSSVILAFTHEQSKPIRADKKTLIADITDGWKVSGSGKEIKRADFFSAGEEHFSGEITFIKEVDLPAKKVGKIILKCEDVTAYASVYINGQFVGARIFSPYEFDLTNFLRSGKNEIAITIGSTQENAMTGSNKNAGIFGNIGIFEVTK